MPTIFFSDARTQLFFVHELFHTVEMDKNCLYFRKAMNENIQFKHYGWHPLK
jgi:hypothetical protein